MKFCTPDQLAEVNSWHADDDCRLGLVEKMAAELHCAWAERDSALARVVVLEEFVRSVCDNYDCDTGANGTHPNQCRCCAAADLLEVMKLIK